MGVCVCVRMCVCVCVTYLNRTEGTIMSDPYIYPPPPPTVRRIESLRMFGACVCV